MKPRDIIRDTVRGFLVLAIPMAAVYAAGVWL